jgi:serine-type D-Ala-D-Ala carboxypeptidase/endopeptidase
MPPIMCAGKIKIVFLIVAVLLGGCNANVSDPSRLPNDAAVPETAVANTGTPLPTETPTRVAATPPASPTPGLSLFTDDDTQASVGHLAAQFMKSARNPGLSVAVIKRDPQSGRLEAMLMNFGTTAKDGGKPVDSNTVYEIGSITKVFTGILLAEAVQDGRMKLDDPIQNYMSEGVHAPTYDGIPITLDELATHRSGLPRDLTSDSLPDLYNWLNGFHMSQAPGSEYIYSNLAYSLLGDILARSANMDYGTLVFQSVDVPLGLMDTTETLSADQASRLAQGYSYDGSLSRYFPQTGAMSGAGYLHSTLNDLTRFVIENMQPQATPLTASLALAQTMQAEGRNPGTGTALGWEIDRLGKPDERIGKGGATPGFSSYVSFKRDGSSGFVLLSNGQYIDNLVPSMIRISSESAN